MVEFKSEHYVDQILNCPFTNEVSKSIFKLKLNKSQGKDGISAEFYRHTCHNISPILTILFNKMVSSGEFPDSWSQSIIVPLHKSGDQSDPSNYKGISLIYVIYNIFSNIVTERLHRWVHGLDIIDDAQSGLYRGFPLLTTCLHSNVWFKHI